MIAKYDNITTNVQCCDRLKYFALDFSKITHKSTKMSYSFQMNVIQKYIF